MRNADFVSLIMNEVKQQEYKEVMGTNPSDSKGTNKPVEMVTWNDAVNFCRKLNKKEEGVKYRLPTEASGNTPAAREQ